MDEREGERRMRVSEGERDREKERESVRGWKREGERGGVSERGRER